MVDNSFVRSETEVYDRMKHWSGIGSSPWKVTSRSGFSKEGDQKEGCLCHGRQAVVW